MAADQGKSAMAHQLLLFAIVRWAFCVSGKVLSSTTNTSGESTEALNIVWTSWMHHGCRSDLDCTQWSWNIWSDKNWTLSIIQWMVLCRFFSSIFFSIFCSTRSSEASERSENFTASVAWSKCRIWVKQSFAKKPSIYKAPYFATFDYIWLHW